MSKVIDIRGPYLWRRMRIVADVGISLVISENDDDVRFVFRRNNGRYSKQAED
jgi:hypothetical protein